MGNVYLAGDSVYVHSPIGGRGMNMGIADAVELAKVTTAAELCSTRIMHTLRQPISLSWVRSNKIERCITYCAMKQGLFYRYLRLNQIYLVNFVIG